MAAERIPSYRHHKPSDRARVTIDGQDIWLGKWNTAESKAKYKRIMSEWLGRWKAVAGKSG